MSTMLLFMVIVFDSMRLAVVGQSPTTSPSTEHNISSSDTSSSSGPPLNVGTIVGVAIFGCVWCSCFCAMLYSTTAGCTRAPVFGGGGAGGGDGGGGDGGDGDGGGGGD